MIGKEHLGTYMESMMATYGYTHEAIDKEEFKTKLEEERLLRSQSEVGSARLFFLKVSTSFSFQAFFGTLILLNAVTMGFEADASEGSKGVFSTLESVFCALFLIEVLVRMLGSPVTPWKDLPLMLDTGIVCISVIDDWILSNTDLTGGDDQQLDLSVLTVLRLLRVIRVARIFRAIAIFRPIRVLLGSLAKAVQNLFWVTLLLLVMFYCFGLTFRMLLSDLDEDEPARPVVDKHFQNVGGCILTGIEVLLRGFDWTDEITTPLIDHQPVAGIFWLFFVAALHVCVANLIIGVFVEQLFVAAKESDLEVEKENLINKAANIKNLKQVFFDMDKNQNGRINRREFKHFMQTHPEAADVISITPEEADILFETVDSQDADMTIDDFLFSVIKLKGGSKNVDTMCFDYQIKQIIRQVQRAPQHVEELAHQLERYEERLGHLTTQMQDIKDLSVVMLPGFEKRLDRMEEQMNAFLVALQVPGYKLPQRRGGSAEDAFADDRPPAPLPQPRAASVAATNPTPPLSLANLRESYQLAEEMRELRKLIEMATGAALGDGSDNMPLPPPGTQQAPPPQHLHGPPLPLSALSREGTGP